MYLLDKGGTGLREVHEVRRPLGRLGGHDSAAKGLRELLVALLDLAEVVAGQRTQLERLSLFL
jgi:hypothetical protein